MSALLAIAKAIESHSLPSFWGVALALFSCLAGNLPAADFEQARATYYRGDYQECIELTRAEVEKGIWNDFWSRHLIKALLTTGEYRAACDVYEQVEERFANSIPLRVLAAEAYRFAGNSEKGDRLLDEIPQLVQAAPWRFSDRDNMLAIGKYVLGLGEDARVVLTSYYDRALKADPKFVDAHLAIAELAMDKADFQEAVRSLKLAFELRPDDPYIRYLLAKAWAPSDSAQASEHLSAALELNPRHPESLLLQARNMIDSENYDAADEVLQLVLEVNPAHPEAWAYKAAMAHLQGEYKQEGEFRSKALASWKLNPQVDFLIGETLSKHYRFAEGVKYQRRALRMSPGFLPAKFQLAQDLLRVGQDDEGWSIVDQVAVADRYNVVAYNLKTLQSRLEQFTTLEAPGFIIRMDSREAQIYGARVIDLLVEAKQVLSEKYEFELTQPVTVEIFPQQSDFAIRTFGLPGGAGFLGVCFGSLITANSPASQGDTPSNWESVLWHEFCHVITLQKTNNRMPRWLSEGISVYEELQRDPSWGQSMNPMYRDMLMSDDFVPLSKLSGAFLNPKSPLHLQFAYFESSLAVSYLIETHGLPLMRRLLVDLGMGVPIEKALAERYGDTQRLDDDFQRYIQEQTANFLPETDFSRDELLQLAGEAELRQYILDHPNNYLARRQLAGLLIQRQEWDKALESANELRKLYPSDTDPGGALELLSVIAREKQDTALEREVLEEFVQFSSDNLPALTRLVVLNRQEEDWQGLADVSEHLLAVQPLNSTGHEGLVAAAKKLDQPELAISSLRALQQMEPLDPAGLHFELAQMLASTGNLPRAREEVLFALEMSPRYREAQKLLVEIHTVLNSPPAPVILPPDDGRPPSPTVRVESL